MVFNFLTQNKEQKFSTTVLNRGGSPNNQSIPPKFVLDPSIHGTWVKGHRLYVAPGRAPGRPTPKITFQWTRNGIPIEGATNKSYTLSDQDVNTIISVIQFATNELETISLSAMGSVVFDFIELNPLSLSNLISGASFSATILGKTSGSTITAISSDNTIINVDGTNITGTFTTNGSKTVTLTETLEGANNSPRISTSQIEINGIIPSIPILANAKLLDGFDNPSSFSPTTYAVDTTRKTQGSGSMVLTGTGTSTAPQATKASVATSFNPQTAGIISWYNDFGDDPDVQDFANCMPRLSVNGVTYTAFSSIVSASDDIIGGRFESRHISNAANIYNAGTGAMGLRRGTTFSTPSTSQGVVYSGKVYADAVMSESPGFTEVLFTFDDIPRELFTYFHQYNVANNVPATAAIPWNNVGIAYGDQGKTRLSISELQEMKNSKMWAFILNGTGDDLSMLTRANPAANVAELALGRQWLKDVGLRNDNCREIVYPNGNTRNAPVDESTTYTSTGTTSVTLAAVGNKRAGLRVTGTNVPANTQIVSIDSSTKVAVLNNVIPSGSGTLRFSSFIVSTGITVSGDGLTITFTAGDVALSAARIGDKFVCWGVQSDTRIQSITGNTITLNKAVPLTITTCKFVDDSNPYHTGKLQAALKAANYDWGRITNNGSVYDWYGLGDQGLRYPALSGSALTAATGLQNLDNAILHGQSISYYFHSADEALGSGLDIKPSEYQAIVQGILQRQQEGKCRFNFVPSYMERMRASAVSKIPVQTISL